MLSPRRDVDVFEFAPILPIEWPEQGEAVRTLLALLAAKVHTLTSDYGKEFADHERIASDLHVFSTFP